MIKLFPSVCGKKVIVKAPYNQKEAVKLLPGRVWNKKIKAWEVPIDNIDSIYKLFPKAMAHPDLHEIAEKVKEKNKRAIEAKNNQEIKVDKIKNFKGNLYGFQKQGVAFLDTLYDKEGAILAFEMGLGKTITAIAAFLKLFQEGKQSKCMIVAPASLKYSAWEKEIKKWVKNLNYIVIDGDSDENKVEYEDGTILKMRGKALREIQYQQEVEFIILNYELFLYDRELIPTVNENWVVVFDEAHRIKNPRAATVQNIISHCRNAGRKYLLTGTPLENNLPELFSLVNFCREGLLGTWYQFKQRYIIEDYFGNPAGINYVNLPSLKEQIAPIMMRKRKDEAFDLPPLIEQEYWVKMTTVQESLYSEVKEGILSIIEDGEEDFSYLDILAKITRIKQLLDSPALLREVTGREDLPVESGKTIELPKILEDINIKENKTIIFSQYKGMTDILYNIVGDLYGYEAVRYIHGGVKAKDRGKYQQDFQEDDKVRIIILTTAGNYGLDLYKASYVICYDQLFNPQKMNQVISRAHRHGVEKTVVAIKMVTRNSYEERILKILEEKKEIFNAMIEEDDDILHELVTNYLSSKELINLL